MEENSDEGNDDFGVQKSTSVLRTGRRLAGLRSRAKEARGREAKRYNNGNNSCPLQGRSQGAGSQYRRNWIQG